MPTGRRRRAFQVPRVIAVTGVADHHGWAVIVTAAADGSVLDRRRGDLVDPDLPPAPIEHDAQILRMDAAVALVREVEHSILLHVRALWDAVGSDHDIRAVAIRGIPEVPTSLEDQIRSYHARTRADSAMYLKVLAGEATSRGWEVHFYDHRRVVDEAIGTLGLAADHLAAPRRDLGPPWTADHRRAYAAALLVHRDMGERREV